MGCPDDQKLDAMDRLRKTVPRQFPDAMVTEEDGLRLDRPNGSWLLIRPSGTDAYIRIFAEGKEANRMIETARDTVTADIYAA